MARTRQKRGFLMLAIGLLLFLQLSEIALAQEISEETTTTEASLAPTPEPSPKENKPSLETILLENEPDGVEREIAPLFYTETCTTMWCKFMQGFPEVNAWLIAVFTFIGLILRASADFVGFVGTKIGHKTTTEVGKKLASYALWAAQVLGWFGGGTPKVVMDKKIAKAVAKEKANDGKTPG